MTTNDAATLKVGNARFYTAPVGTPRPTSVATLKAPGVLWTEVGNTTSENIVNLTSVFGSRMRGPTGAIAAWCGFLLLPFCVMLAAAILYERYGDVEAVRRVLTGIAPAAAGLMIATVAKMAAPMFKSLGPAPLVIVATTIAIGLMRWPLLWVMLVMVPVSIGLAWWVRR